MNKLKDIEQQKQSLIDSGFQGEIYLEKYLQNVFMTIVDFWETNLEKSLSHIVDIHKPNFKEPLTLYLNNILDLLLKLDKNVIREKNILLNSSNLRLDQSDNTFLKGDFWSYWNIIYAGNNFKLKKFVSILVREKLILQKEEIDQEVTKKKSETYPQDNIEITPERLQEIQKSAYTTAQKKLEKFKKELLAQHQDKIHEEVKERVRLLLKEKDKKDFPFI